MVRRLDKRSRIIKKDILGQLAYRNIVKIKQAFIADSFIYIGLKYY